MTKMAKRTAARKTAPVDAKVLPLVTEDAQRTYEYRVLCNERKAGPLEHLPMIGVVGRALGHPFEHDVMQGLLAEIETRTTILGMVFAGEQFEPSELHNRREELEAEMLMLKEKVSVVRELLRRNAKDWQSPGGMR